MLRTNMIDNRTNIDMAISINPKPTIYRNTGPDGTDTIVRIFIECVFRGQKQHIWSVHLVLSPRMYLAVSRLTPRHCLLNPHAHRYTKPSLCINFVDKIKFQEMK